MTEVPMDPAVTEMLSVCAQKYEQAYAAQKNKPYAVLQSLNFVVQQSNETTI